MTATGEEPDDVAVDEIHLAPEPVDAEGAHELVESVGVELAHPVGAGGVGGLMWLDGPDAWAGLGDGPELGLTAHVGAGLAWRPKRRWSVDLTFRYHVFPLDVDAAVGPVDVALTFSLYRDR